jgi:hypothetical protein
LPVKRIGNKFLVLPGHHNGYRPPVQKGFPIFPNFFAEKLSEILGPLYTRICYCQNLKVIRLDKNISKILYSAYVDRVQKSHAFKIEKWRFKELNMQAKFSHDFGATLKNVF